MIWALTRGASPSEGSSSSSTRGRAISARPIESIWRSPPESEAASCVRRSRRGGKSSYMSLRAAASRASPEAAEAQVLLGRELGDHAATLGHVREPAPGDVLDRDTEDLLAVEPHVSAARALEPGDRAQQRGLARAVGAQHGRDAALIDGERDSIHGAHGPVVGRELLDLQECHRAQAPSPPRAEAMPSPASRLPPSPPPASRPR